MKKKLWIILSAAAVAVITVVALSIVLTRPEVLQLSINGKTVDQEEYLQVMNNEIYTVTQLFTTKYGTTVDSEFWETDFNGEIPYRVLADHTIEKLKNLQAVYGLAKEKGYIDSADYQALLTRFEKENHSRKEKIEKGEPVYGLSEFTLDLYMEYEMDAIQKEYCSDLNNEGMQLSEEDINAYYEEKKDILFQKDDDIELSYIKIDPVLEGLDELQMETLQREMENLYKQVDGDSPMSSLITENQLLFPYYHNQKILSAEMGSQSKTIGDVLELAAGLKKGECTQVIEQNGTLYLIQCTDRVEYDYLPLTEVKDNIEKNLREQRYNELIAEKAQNAVLEGDLDDVYAFTLENIKK